MDWCDVVGIAEDLVRVLSPSDLQRIRVPENLSDRSAAEWLVAHKPEMITEFVNRTNRESPRRYPAINAEDVQIIWKGENQAVAVGTQ